MNVTQHSASIAGSNAGNDILEWHNRWSAISFSERWNQHWLNPASKKGVGPQSYLWQTKTAALTKQYVPVHCYCISTSLGSVTIMDIFSGLTPSDVAKPPASNAEYCLAWRNKFLISKALNPHIQIPSPTCFFMFSLNCLVFFSCIENEFFNWKHSFWAVTVYSALISCWTFKMEFWSLLTYPAVPGIQMHVLLLVVGEQSRNKPHGDPPHTDVLYYNLHTCSTFYTRCTTCQ